MCQKQKQCTKRCAVIFDRIFLTIAVRSKCPLWTAHFDSFNAEPFMQIRMFCFSAIGNKTGRRLTTILPKQSSNKHLCHTHLSLWQYLHWQTATPTSWTTKFQNALRAPLPCGCTRNCCCRTAPPRSPWDGSRCEEKKECEAWIEVEKKDAGGVV